MKTESCTQRRFQQLWLVREESEPGYLRLCSIIPAAAGTRRLAQTWKELRYYPLIWTGPQRGPDDFMTGVSSHRGLRWPNSSISPCCKLIKHQIKSDNQHAAQVYTSLWCCVSPLRARGEKELPMHLIKGPLESSSSYRRPRPSRRRTPSRKCTGWAY